MNVEWGSHMLSTVTSSTFREVTLDLDVNTLEDLERLDWESMAKSLRRLPVFPVIHIGAGELQSDMMKIANERLL